ncbi:hypothetical protein CY34DRAFT_432714 [Suillus luteus UH-Slu-Lm8-n1]|uniref:Uncharacterized protein n=1 Tax=Suillus luteus UH-Slu-Lm8-n1 TaxID=930992 RepID=A0A0D0BHH5_9AGAM|nr:hypothetical protein CY34DRAFT_432714 [Suillus luteus UH-Slu-Lm8-n1]
METRTVDTTILLHVAVVHLTCNITERLLDRVRTIVTIPVNTFINKFYTEHLLHEEARLDLPTYEDSDIRKQFSSVLSPSGSCIAWMAIEEWTSLATSIISVIFQLSVLFTVLRDQQDGFLLMILGASQSIFQWFSSRKAVVSPLLWGANTTNTEYLRMRGLKNLCEVALHRKELVAGDLGEYITEQYLESARSTGNDACGFMELYALHCAKKRLSHLDPARHSKTNDGAPRPCITLPC